MDPIKLGNNWFKHAIRDLAEGMWVAISAGGGEEKAKEKFREELSKAKRIREFIISELQEGQ